MRIIAVLLVFYCQLAAAERLETRSLLDGRLSIDLPSGFTAMPESMKRIKYPGKRRPAEVYSTSDGAVSFAFNYTQTEITEAEIEDAHRALSGSFRHAYPDAEWYRSGVYEQSGLPVFVLELTTPARDTRIHNLMIGMPLDGRLLLIAFNTTVEQRDRWLEAGHAAMQSIRVLQKMSGNDKDQIDG